MASFSLVAPQMTMLPDVDSESWAQYSADQFTSSATDRINALAATPDPGLVSHLGGGPSPDQASAGSTADMSPPPAATPSPEPVPAAPAPAPLPVPYAPVTAPFQAPQPAPTPTPTPAPAQPDWIAGALNAVDQAGGDVQKFAQGLQTGAGDLIGSALNAADAAGADVQKFVGALPPIPGTATQPADTGPASSDDQTAYIRQAAAARGIDPDVAVKVASSEGLNTYVGDNGSSFGPFQLHYGGVASGGNAVGGLGDEFTRQTGLDARDPSTWRQQVDFALNQAAQGGWGPWHGAARVGIAPREGISPNAAPGPVTVADQADRAQTQTVSPSTSALMSKVQPFLGDPYVWGGKDPNTGFDCSGFVGYVEGTGQPESTTTLYAKSGGIDQKSAQPGDLVFYNMGQSDMHLQHVGVYLGNGKIAQAGGTNDTVNVADVNQQVGSAPEFRRLDAGSTPPTAGQPAQVQQVNNDPIGWLGQQKDALTSSISSGASALGSALQPQVSQPVATQTMPSDSLTDPIGTRYTLSPTGQPQAATTLPATPAVPQDATSATPAPQGPLEAVKQKFSDAIDALGGLLAPAQPAAQAAAGAAQDFAQNGPIGATRSAVQGATNYVTSGQAKSDLADTLSSQADQSPLGPAVPGPVQSAVLNTAAGFLRSPTVLESAQTVTNLTQKYAPGQLYIPDESVMTPEDRRAYEQARLAVGGLTGGEGATYDKFGVQEGFVPPAAKQAPPAEPAAPSNPFELTAAAPAGAQPLTQDEVVGHLEYLDSLHAQNDARLSELQNQLEGGYFKNASGDRGGGGIVRPPQFAGWTDQAIIDYARREGLNPYQVGWFGGGKGELEGYARSVGATKGTATQARAEVAQLEAQQSQIEAAMENGWNTGSAGQPLYRQSVAPAGLPWDNGSGATSAAEPGSTPANAGGGTPRPAPQAAGGAAQAGTPSTVEPAAPGLIPNANRARANAADIASGGTRAERLAQPVPTQASDASDAVLQGLINEAKQRGIDTSSIEAQIKPPITADMITSPGPAEGSATAGGRIQPTQPASEARSVREIVSTTVANKQGPPGITVEPQGFLGRSTPEMGSAVVYRDKTGMPQGILSITNDEKGNPDVAEVAVNPAFQRQGIATQLYQTARDAGLNVDAVTGRGGYTPEGAAFAQSRINRLPPSSAEAPPAVQYDANGNVARVNGQAVGGGGNNGAGSGGTTTGGTPPQPPEGPQGLPTTPAPVQRAGITPDTVQIAHQRIDRAIDPAIPRNYDMHQQLDTMLANGASPAEVARFLSGTVEGQKVTPMNVLRTVRTGSMAGGLTTEGKVLAGPVIQTAMRAPVAAVKSLVTGNPGDIRAGLQGSMAGLAEGAQEALQTLRYGINYRSALAGGAQGGYGFAPGLDVMGKNPLTRAAGTLATGLVRSHGAIADVSASIGRGAALARGATPEAAAQAGQHWALRSGQYGSVGQAVSKALEGLRNVNPAMDVAGQILVPFYRVGYNAFTQGVERSPVGLVGTAADVARGKLPASAPAWMRGPYAPGANAGGAVTPVGDRLTNNMFGVGLAGLGLAQAASGNITGQNPPVGSPKWSIRVPETAKLGPVEAVAKRDPQGNLWVPIRSLGPAGEALAQSAALYEAARDGKGSVPDMAARTASEYVNHLEDETWLGSITSALNLIADVGNATSPLKLAASQAKRDIAYQASSLGKSFIPQEKLGEQVSKAFGNYVPPAAKPAATAAPVAPARTPAPTVTRRYVPPARATPTPRARP